MAQEVLIHTNVLQRPREELLEETKGIETKKRLKCYVANILIGGILTTALIDTGAEVTCLSEEFVNKNRERLQECPTLPINGVTLVGPLKGKAIRLNKQIYADIHLPNHIIQVTFLVVPKLSRPCIIGIELLDEFRSHINLDSKTISFPHLEGKPSIRIINEEARIPSEEKKQTMNAIQTARDEIEVERREIRLKVEVSTTNPEKRERLEDILCRQKAVFRKEPGRLKSYQHILQVKEKQPFIGRSYPIPIAYREKSR